MGLDEHLWDLMSYLWDLMSNLWDLMSYLWDLMSWMKHVGKLDLKRGWCALMESLIGRGGVGGVPRESTG